MKHPALTRLFSITLAILSLVMLTAGALGISGAAEDRSGAMADVNRLRNRIDEYNTVTAALDGTISYAEANRILQERQAQHEQDAAQHRSDLAIYSATRGGVQSGAEALEQAKGAMGGAWAQYRAAEEEFAKGEAAFYEGYQQFLDGRAQVEAGLETLSALKAGLGAVSAIPGGIVGIVVYDADEAESPEEPDGPEEPNIPEEPDGPEEPNTPEEPGTPEEPEEPGDDDSGDGPSWPPDWFPELPDVEWPSELPDWFPELPDVEWPSELPDVSQWPNIFDRLPGQSESPPEAEGMAAVHRGSGPRVTLLSASQPQLPDLPEGLLPDFSAWLGQPEAGRDAPYAQREQVLAAYDSLIAGYDSLNELISSVGSLEELPDEAQQQMGLLTGGMTLTRQAIQLERSSIAAGSGPVTGLELSVARGTHQTGKEVLASTVSQITGQMAPMITELEETLGAAKQELDAMAPEMEATKATIEQGRAALDQAYKMLSQGSASVNAGWEELQKTLEELTQQAREMQENKESLQQDAQELKTMAAEAQEQKNMERRQTSLRVTLMDRDGVRERVDKGMDLVKSAEACARDMEGEAKHSFALRLVACIAMIVGGMAGLLSVLAAFEKLRGRFLLIAPPVLCLLCAAGAETVFELMGRGSSYSAIFAGIFALVFLVIVIPKEKKKA